MSVGKSLASGNVLHCVKLIANELDVSGVPPLRGSRIFVAKSIEEACATPDIPRQTAMATKQQKLFIFPAPFS
jgi:hypothetical protein